MEADWTFKDLVLGAVGVVVGLIAWFGRRDVRRFDDGLDRIAALERTIVTREELERRLEKMEQELEKRLEKMEKGLLGMHKENTNFLTRIDSKIESYEKRRARTEHSIRDMAGALNLKVILVGQKLGIDLPSSPVLPALDEDET